MDQYLDRLEAKAAQRERAIVEAAAKAAAEEKDKRRVQRLFAKGNSPEDIAEGMELDLNLVKEWLSAPAVV